MDEQVESWQNQIREIAPVMQTAEYELLKSEADVKRVLALWKTVALSEGIKTTSGQDTFAENHAEVYQSRLRVAVAKGQLSAVKVRKIQYDSHGKTTVSFIWDEDEPFKNSPNRAEFMT